MSNEVIDDLYTKNINNPNLTLSVQEQSVSKKQIE